MSALADSSKRWHIVLRCTICGPLGILFSFTCLEAFGTNFLFTRKVPHAYISRYCNAEYSSGLSIYAPPNQYIDIKDLEHLLSQINEPVMILGDFNARNPLWGSDQQTPKGRVIETFIGQNDLCLYNDGSHTFLHSSNGTYSAIDLSFTSPALFLIVFHGKSMMIAVVVTISQLFLQLQ